MFRLFRKSSFEDPVLGKFFRAGGSWFSGEIATPAGVLGVTIEGDREGPAAASLEVARELIREPSEHIRQALDYVRCNRAAMEFADGNGEIVVDGFSVQRSGEFAVELSLSEWADAMITVPFRQGSPCDVLLGD